MYTKKTEGKITTMAKTTEERIQSVQEQIQQLENQKKKLLQEHKEQERKARTKRLIERGAILESLIPNAENLTNEEVKAFLEKTIQSDAARKILAAMTKQNGAMAALKPTGLQPQSGATPNGNSASTAQGMGH